MFAQMIKEFTYKPSKFKIDQTIQFYYIKYIE